MLVVVPARIILSTSHHPLLAFQARVRSTSIIIELIHLVADCLISRWSLNKDRYQHTVLDKLNTRSSLFTCVLILPACPSNVGCMSLTMTLLFFSICNGRYNGVLCAHWCQKEERNDNKECLIKKLPSHHHHLYP